MDGGTGSGGLRATRVWRIIRADCHTLIRPSLVPAIPNNQKQAPRVLLAPTERNQKARDLEAAYLTIHVLVSYFNPY